MSAKTDRKKLKELSSKFAGDHPEAQLLRSIIDEFCALLEASERIHDTLAANVSPIINKEKFLNANEHLKTVLKETEDASNQIMLATESIQALTEKMDPETAEKVIGHVTEIFTACGFQDITGQRIQSALKLFIKVELSLGSLLESLNQYLNKVGLDSFKTTPAEGAKGAELLNGPQLPKQAMSQDEIDALMEGSA